MLSQFIEKSNLRQTPTEHHLHPCLGKIIALLQKLEGMAESDYFEAFERREMKKGEYLLCEGEVSNRIWFLETGIARMFTSHNGKDISHEFYFASEFVDWYSSSTLNMPAMGHIQLMTDAITYSIRWDRFQRLKVKYPLLNEIERQIVACHMHSLEMRTIELKSLSATDRYRQLIQRQPKLFQYIQLTHIASYLGVNMETLSRIRHQAF